MMRLLLALLTLVASLSVTPVLAKPDCCQCGPFACGPAPEGSDCAGCEAVTDAICDGGSGKCRPALEGLLPNGAAAAPAVGGGPAVLLGAALAALGLSLLVHRRQRL